MMAIRPIVQEFRRLHRAAAVTDQRIARATIAGKVAVVEGRRARLQIGTGEDGSAVLGPWATWEEPAVGTLSTATPLKVGQQASYVSPSGTLGDGTSIRPRAHDDDNAAPSEATDAAVTTLGSTSITIRDGSVTYAFGGVSTTIGADGITQTGGAITHDGIPVDKTHHHDRVRNGPDVTGTPV